jgi:hypothetical protein
MPDNGEFIVFLSLCVSLKVCGLQCLLICEFTLLFKERRSDDFTIINGLKDSVIKPHSVKEYHMVTIQSLLLS